MENNDKDINRPALFLAIALIALYFGWQTVSHEQLLNQLHLLDWRNAETISEIQMLVAKNEVIEKVERYKGNKLIVFLTYFSPENNGFETKNLYLSVMTNFRNLQNCYSSMKSYIMKFFLIFCYIKTEFNFKMKILFPTK